MFSFNFPFIWNFLLWSSCPVTWKHHETCKLHSIARKVLFQVCYWQITLRHLPAAWNTTVWHSLGAETQNSKSQIPKPSENLGTTKNYQVITGNLSVFRMRTQDFNTEGFWQRCTQYNRHCRCCRHWSLSQAKQTHNILRQIKSLKCRGFLMSDSRWCPRFYLLSAGL